MWTDPILIGITNPFQTSCAIRMCTDPISMSFQGNLAFASNIVPSWPQQPGDQFTRLLPIARLPGFPMQPVYPVTVMLGLKGSLALGKTLATALRCVQVRSVANPRGLLTFVSGSLVWRLLRVLMESAVGQGQADLLTCC